MKRHVIVVQLLCSFRRRNVPKRGRHSTKVSTLFMRVKCTCAHALNYGALEIHLYRNRPEITVLMSEKTFFPLWFSCWGKSSPVQSEHRLIFPT